MSDFNYSVFCLDFRNFDSGETLDAFFKEVGLDLNGKSWYLAHLGQWIQGSVINKVWIDSITLSLVAYETDQKQMIYPSFAEFLSNSPSIDRNFRYGNFKLTHRKDLNVDSILDKILVSGTESLTFFEKNFLDEFNRNS